MKSNSGTQTAMLTMTVEMAQIAVELGRIRVVWASYRIRERFVPDAPGHLVRNCNSAAERRYACIKCGKDRHLAKEYSSEPRKEKGRGGILRAAEARVLHSKKQ